MEGESETERVSESDHVEDVVFSSESEAATVDVPVKEVLPLLLGELDAVTLTVKESETLKENVSESECVTEEEALKVIDEDVEVDED